MTSFLYSVTVMLLDTRLSVLFLVGLVLYSVFVVKDNDWENFRTVAEVKGDYGTLVVRNHKEKEFSILQCEDSVLGGIWLGHTFPHPIFHAFYIESAIVGLEKEFSGRIEIMQIGLGVGSVTNILLSHNWKNEILIESVEIDPLIYELATKYFQLPRDPRLKMATEDGRAFVKKSESKKFDFVIHDVFTAGIGTKHLMTLEAIKDVKRVLVDDGVLVFTFVGAQAPSLNRGSQAIMCTLSEIFNFCRFFPESQFSPESRVLSVIAFCSDKPLVFSKNTRDYQCVSEAHAEIIGNFQKWEWQFSNSTCTNNHVMTDEHNTLDELQLPVQQHLWKQIKRSLQS
eukprot:TRINITY_DN5214_c0_g1_i1.p1 TRINITY_DN5214_c0_g1~~TRINITY_DN5214_c0_g1_i1.p1  ORF type:complete len:341 (+),score=51.37 TRINITY_DN5214_c0_g1_i1:141-1163(+)